MIPLTFTVNDLPSLKKMSIKPFICSLFLLFFATIINGQTYYSVAAEGGLYARSTPSLTAPRVGKFASGENVILLRETMEFLVIKDSTTPVEGYWVQVKSESGIVGYVCSGYLIEKHQDFDYHNYCDEYYGDCDATLKAKDYQINIFNYQMDAHYNAGDTLFISEAVFNEIGDCVFQLKPKEGGVKIKVYHTVYETLNAWGYTKNEAGIIPRWMGHEPYVELEPTNHIFYRVPVTDYEGLREARAKKLKLKRYSPWDYESEVYWVPHYTYRGVRAPYFIEAVLLKIVLIHPNGKVQFKYIKITLSYGC